MQFKSVIFDFLLELYLKGFSTFLLKDKFKAKLPLKLSSLFSAYVSSSKFTEKFKLNLYLLYRHIRIHYKVYIKIF